MQTFSVDTGFRFEAQEMKVILNSKADCLRVGFSTDDIIIKTLDDIRRHYILKVGLPSYISQMLGGLGQVPVRNCAFYREDGARLPVELNGNAQQSLSQFIAAHFHQQTLPFKVVIAGAFGRGGVEVCYL